MFRNTSVLGLIYYGIKRQSLGNITQFKFCNEKVIDFYVFFSFIVSFNDLLDQAS